MAYSKQNFQDGQILNAANLEAMENGIIAGQGVKNLLVNSDFKHVINTQGKTSYSGSGFTVDEWRAFHTSTTHEVTSNGIKVSGAMPNLYQPLDTTVIDVNKNYTCAAQDSDGNIYIYYGKPSNTTGAAPICVYTSESNVLFRLAKADTTWAWAALYEGYYTKDTLPDYVPKDRSTELFDCGVSSQPYNLIINGNFRKNAFIASDELNTNGYLGNKWKGHVSITAVQNDSNIKLTASAQYSYIYQRIDVEVGKAYTFVVKTPTISSAARVSIYNSDLSEIFSNQEASSSDKIIITTAIPTSSPISCLFYPGFTADGGYSTIEYAALYEGAYNRSTLPTYTPYPKQIEMMRCGMAVQPENLLNNSDFTNVINSKGLSSYEGQVEGIDGWTGRVIAQKVEVESTDVKISATGTAYAAIRQKIVKIPKLVRKTITFAAKLYSNVDADIRIADAGENMLAYSINPAGQTNILIVNYTVPSGATADTVVPTIMLRTQASGNYMKLYWAALYEGVYDASTLPSYIPKGRHVEMLNCNVPLAPRNLLDNSDFRNPVNQRGKTEYSGYNYNVDRWYGNTGYQTVSVQKNYITVSAGNTAYCGIRQKVENMAKLAGKTVTFAAQIYSSVGTRLTLLDANGNALVTANGDAGKNQTLILTYTVPSDATSDSVVPTIICKTQAKGDSANIYWAALYEGSYDASTLPAYQPKGYAAELAACRCYYQVIPEQTSCSFATSAQSSKYFASSINFPQMRITPTVSLKTDSDGYIGVVQGVSFVSASEFDFAYKLNGTLLPATTNANYAGKVMSLYGVELSADL